MHSYHFKILLLCLLTLLLLYLCLACGRAGLDNPFLTINDKYQRFLLLEIRLPRALTAIIAGMMLAISGAIFQIILRNPLASPDIIGINSGASLGVMLALVFFPNQISLAFSAFCGALFIAATLYPFKKNLIDARNNRKIILSGLAMAALCNACINFFIANIELDQAQQLKAMLSGSLANKNWHEVYFAVFIVLFWPLILFLNKRFRYFSLNNETQIALGINVNFIQKIGLLFAIFYASLSVILVGPISFVALIAPQIARQFKDFSKASLIFSMLIGALLLLFADFITLILPTASRLTTGTIALIIGGLYLMVFLYQKNKTSIIA